MKIEIELFNNNYPVWQDFPNAISTSINIVGLKKLTPMEQKTLHQAFLNLLKKLE